MNFCIRVEKIMKSSDLAIDSPGQDRLPVIEVCEIGLRKIVIRMYEYKYIPMPYATILSSL